MSWLYYLEAKIRFPFRARCTASRTTQPLHKGEPMGVRRLAPEDACSGDMVVVIRWQDRNLAAPPS